TRERGKPGRPGPVLRGAIEWRVIGVALTLFMYSFGYGGITSFSALYADARGIAPRSLYFIVFCLTTLVVRVFSGRLAEAIGYRRVFVPCLGLIVVGYALLALSHTRAGFVASAIVFGLGFGAAWPVFVAHVLQYFGADRRGAVFGAVLSCF